LWRFCFPGIAVADTLTTEKPMLTPRFFATDQEWGGVGLRRLFHIGAGTKVMPTLRHTQRKYYGVNWHWLQQSFPYYMNTYGMHTAYMADATTMASSLKQQGRVECLDCNKRWRCTQYWGGNHTIHLLHQGTT
jgi:hypothetical protein